MLEFKKKVLEVIRTKRNIKEYKRRNSNETEEKRSQKEIKEIRNTIFKITEKIKIKIIKKLK